jgi:hypothetical protein
MRMHRSQHHWADVRQIKPQCELPSEHAAMLAVATPRHDLHTTQSVALGSAQERSQCMKRLLCRHAMQVEFSRTGELPAAEPLPTGGIDPRRLSADTQRRRL